MKKSQRCTPASHAVRPTHSRRQLSAIEAGWRSVRSSHLYHCRRWRRPRYQLMGRHLHHCHTDCLYYGRVSQHAGQCHLAISTAEVLEAEVTWDVGQSRVTCPRCHAAGFSRAGSESTTAVDVAAADSLMSSGTLPLSQQRVCNSI